jgi:hypothetical protein
MASTLAEEGRVFPFHQLTKPREFDQRLAVDKWIIGSEASVHSPAAGPDGEQHGIYRLRSRNGRIVRQRPSQLETEVPLSISAGLYL